MTLKEKIELFKEFFLFLREKKNWILIPLLIMILILIIISIFIETPALLPFFYAIF